MKNPMCCICDPEIPINPYVCFEHKTEALKIAKTENIRYADAADRLYWQAVDAQGVSL